MIRNLLVSTWIVALSSLSLIGCSGNPVMTDPMSATVSNQEADALGESHNCLGYYLLAIDTAASSVDVVPLRTADIHANMVSVLNSTLGIDAAGVPEESDPPNGIFAFDITVSHPFGKKPQLAGFDVKGILVTPGSDAIAGLKFADLDETRLLNSDGYTRWWNPAEFTQAGLLGYTKGILANAQAATLTANVNPYKQFADILGPLENLETLDSVDLDDIQGRGVFTAGAVNTRRYRIQFPVNPEPQVVFGYAVDASWAPPSPSPPVEVPDDFPINANQPEAYRVDVTTTVNTLYYDSETGHGGGVLRLRAGIRDWQGTVAGNVHGDIDAVRAYCPGLITGASDLAFASEAAGMAVYEGDSSPNAMPIQSGDHLLALGVVSKGGLTYDQGTPPAPSDPISAWNVTTIQVTDPDCAEDSNNSTVEAEIIGPNASAIGVLCPTVDPSDFFKLTIPAGKKVTGKISYIHSAFDQGSEALRLTDSHWVEQALGASYEGYCEMSLDGLNLGPGNYYIDVSALLDTGAFQYLLETAIDLIDISPSNPVDITPVNLDCYVTWVDATGASSDILAGAGPAGTFDFSLNDLSTRGRIADLMQTEPAFNYLYYYYVEDNDSNPARIAFDDYTDQSAPVHHEDVLTLNGPVSCMTMNSQNLYVVYDDGTHAYVRIYDYVADPANPVYVDEFQVLQDQKKIELMDPEGPDTVLVSINPQNLVLYSVEDPHNAALLDTSSMSDTFANRDFDVDNDLIAKTYVNSGNGSVRLQALKYDSGTGLSDWGTVALGGFGSCVAVRSGDIFVENGDQGITCVDAVGPADLQFRDSVETIGTVFHLDAKSNWLCSAEGAAGPVVYDITDHDNIVVSIRAFCLNCPRDGVLEGDYSYFIDSTIGYSELKVLVQSSDSYIISTQTLLNGQATCMTGEGDMILVGSLEDKKVWLFDAAHLSDPPLLVYSKTYSSPVTSVEVTQTTGYIALQDGTLKLLDLSAFPTVTESADYSFPGKVYNLKNSGHWLYGTNLDKVPYFDVSAPLEPSYIGDYNYGNTYNVYDMELQGFYMYLCTSDTLQIADFFDPSNPAVSDGVHLPYSAGLRFFTVNGSYAYVADKEDNPVVVTLFPPDSPSIFGEPFGDPFPFRLNGITSYEDRLFIMHDIVGLRIFDLY